jgi:hypothetical protein
MTDYLTVAEVPGHTRRPDRALRRLASCPGFRASRVRAFPASDRLLCHILGRSIEMPLYGVEHQNIAHAIFFSLSRQIGDRVWPPCIGI